MAIEIDIEGKSIVELRQQLKGLRDDLARATDPEDMARLAEGAGKVRDKMKDLNEQVAVFAAGSKFEQAGIAIGQIGADLGNLDFEGAAEKAVKLTQVVKSITFTEATKGLKDLGTTFLGLGKALLTNPLFLIPAAITGILAALGLLGPIIDGVKKMFELLSQAVSDFLDYIGVTNTKLDELKEKQKAAKEESDKQTEAIRKESTAFVSLITKLKATNEGSKERKTLIKEINKEYGTTLKNISDETAFQNQLNLAVEEYIKQKYNEFNLKANEEKLVELFQKKSAATKEFNKQLRGLTDGYTLVDKANNKWQSDFDGTILTLGELRSKGQTYNKVMLDQEKILRDVDAQILNIGKSSLQYSSTVKTAVVPATKTLKTEVENVKEVLVDLNQELDPKYLNDFYNTLNKIFNKGIVLPAPEIADETIDTTIVEEATKEVNDYWTNLELNATKSYEGLKALRQARMEEEIRMTKATGDEEALIRQKYADEEKDRQRAAMDARLQIAQDGLNLMSGLTELFNDGSEKDAKKAFENNKKVSMAQALIQTYQAAQGAYLSQMSIPSPDAPIRASIAAGVAVAAGLVNVAKISKTKYNSTTPDSSNPSGSVSSPSSTPSYNLFGNNNNANTVNATPTNVNVQNEVKVKAYVSETDITDAQNRVSRYQSSATL
jgi:hypothetical protein